jgi:leader peptidase (prepilin peptidase)/N-methyltransferase
MLASLAIAILRGRESVRALTPTAWAFVGGAAWLAADAGRLGWFAAPSAALFAGLVVAALIDARYFILPDGPLAFLALLGAAYRLAGPSPELITAIAATAFAFLMFRLADWCFQWWRGVPGLGKGDARLFALAGLWLGFEGLASCLLIAVFSAALAASIALRDGTLAHARDPLPFGPHLALGFWLTWTLGPIMPA